LPKTKTIPASSSKMPQLCKKFMAHIQFDAIQQMVFTSALSLKNMRRSLRISKLETVHETPL
jgi:hypothetical protein